MSQRPFEIRVREDLAAAIDGADDFADPAAAAEALLAKDTAQYRLVGVRRRGTRAIFHETILRKVVSVPFDEGGVDDLAEDDVRDVTSRPDVERWVAECEGGYWHWLHPRFAWVRED
ncbi:hypothetical protein [Halorientalis halophila]|uniref:hypothetical protein n=1 Tax=Halorientalis halophila TaxID=3108499 RepID=UPI00300B8048